MAGVTSCGEGCGGMSAGMGTSIATSSATSCGWRSPARAWSTGVGALANRPGGRVGYLGTMSVNGSQLTESVTACAVVSGMKML